MTKTINFTFLLRHPDKVREMVKKGIKLLVKYEGEVVMEINMPKPKVKNNQLPPVLNIPESVSPHDTYRRVDMYDKKYEL
jgi:hypothetical protein